MKGRFGELQTFHFDLGAREGYGGDFLEHCHTVYTGQLGHQAWSAWAGPAWQTWSSSVTEWPTEWMKENAMHVVYLGLSKAFYTIPHSILLEKMSAQDMDGCAVGWVQNWMDGQAREWWWMEWHPVGGGHEWCSPGLSWGQSCLTSLSVIWVRLSSAGNTKLNLHNGILDLTMIMSATLWKYLGKATFL